MAVESYYHWAIVLVSFFSWVLAAVFISQVRAKGDMADHEDKTNEGYAWFVLLANLAIFMYSGYHTWQDMDLRNRAKALYSRLGGGTSAYSPFDWDF